LPNFAPAVVAPVDLCTDKNNRVHGYTMPYVDNSYLLKSLSSRDFRLKAGIDNKRVVSIFRQLADTVDQLHRNRIVVGDFTPFNVLVDANGSPRPIDADSMQFNGFLCETFSPRYADPLLFELNSGNLQMIAPHNESSDWYAFGIMLFEALMFVHPYGGVYKPQNGVMVPPDHRPMKRLSVFDPSVVYPAAAVPIAELPEAVRRFFVEVFTKDQRGAFPEALFDVLDGRIFVAPPPAPPPTRGVYHAGGKFFREGGKLIMTGDPDPNLHFIVFGDSTVVSKNGQTFVITADGIQPLPVEYYRDRIPCVAATDTHLYWIAGGELWCQSQNGTREHIDSVIGKQTRIWAGTTFGVGLSHVGGIVRAFTFQPGSPRKSVDLGGLSGYIEEADCTFVDGIAYLSITTKPVYGGTHHANTNNIQPTDCTSVVRIAAAGAV
jgi:hypothetical protein